MYIRKNYDPYERVQTHPVGESRCQQNLADETDINYILRKQVETGLVKHVNTHQGQYGNFASSTDYHDCMNKVAAADQAFSTLPADLRAQFENDPAQFLEFVGDPENIDEMRDMGLLPPAEQLPDVPDQAVDPGPIAAGPAEPDPGA